MRCSFHHYSNSGGQPSGSSSPRLVGEADDIDQMDREILALYDPGCFKKNTAAPDIIHGNYSAVSISMSLGPHSLDGEFGELGKFDELNCEKTDNEEIDCEGDDNYKSLRHPDAHYDHDWDTTTASTPTTASTAANTVITSTTAASAIMQNLWNMVYNNW